MSQKKKNYRSTTAKIFHRYKINNPTGIVNMQDAESSNEPSNMTCRK